MTEEHNLSELLQLTQDVTRCFKCDIGEDTDSRGYRVVYRGSLKPKYLFIGEAPGKMEETLGRPFVGRAGKVLQSIINDLSIVPYAITNVIRCRPTKLVSATKLGDRQPTKIEMGNCRPFLERTVNLFDPEVLIVMGMTAIRAIIDSTAYSVGDSRGLWYHPAIGDKQYLAMATYHPAAVLYDSTKEDLLRGDIARVVNPQVL